jgi:hypothetical protein
MPQVVVRGFSSMPKRFSLHVPQIELSVGVLRVPGVTLWQLVDQAGLSPGMTDGEPSISSHTP